MQAVKIGLHSAVVKPNNVNTEIITAASNVNGMIIQTCSANSGNGVLNLHVATSLSDNGAIILTAVGNTVAGYNDVTVMPYPVYVPPGLGVWASANVATAAVILTWDYLS